MHNQEINKLARQKVENELLKRGASSVTSKKGRRVVLYATSADNNRSIEIYVKAKQKGNWHTRTNEAVPSNNCDCIKDFYKFWIFVELNANPRFWIVPDPWIRNDIYAAHKKYLEKHGGQRPKNDASNHHSIDEMRIQQWLNKWDILRIF